ncbi:MAG: hypothetical protein QOD84_2523 [Acidobacteriaceae bacterium]
MEIFSSKSQFQSGGKRPNQSSAQSDFRLKLKARAAIALILSLSLSGVGCSSQWISVALADLPVLAQMALNIGTLVTTLQSEKQLSPAETSAVQNISAEAGRDVNLLQSLYSDYKSTPNPDTIQKIDAAIEHISQSLVALLQAAHISDPVLASRVTAGVNLIVATVTSFAALVPHAAMTSPSTSRTVASHRITIPHSRELKKQWNHQVCAPSGNAALDSAYSLCVVR